MIRNNLLLIIFAGIFMALLSGCGVYSFTGASIPPGAETISIQYFPNNSDLVEPTLSPTFTDALKDKFSSQTTLDIVDNAGDLQISGAITAYRVIPVAITGDQVAAQNRLEITVNVDFVNTLEEENSFYDESFKRYVEYDSQQDLSAVQTGLIDEITQILVEDIFNKAVVNW